MQLKTCKIDSSISSVMKNRYVLKLAVYINIIEILHTPTVVVKLYA